MYEDDIKIFAKNERRTRKPNSNKMYDITWCASPNNYRRREMESATLDQILDKAECVSLYANALEKDTIPYILSAPHLLSYE